MILRCVSKTGIDSLSERKYGSDAQSVFDEDPPTIPAIEAIRSSDGQDLANSEAFCSGKRRCSFNKLRLYHGNGHLFVWTRQLTTGFPGGISHQEGVPDVGT